MPAVPSRAVPPPAVHVLGIRHHGPGSARSVLQALDALRPARLLVEGPPELDAVVGLLGDADTVPPVAGLVYAVDEPRRSIFYPLAAFSPEWVAIRWALAHGVPVAFADLAASQQLALGAAREAPEPVDADDPAPEGDEERPGDPLARPDPLTVLARAAGYDDAERWWEDAVEHRHDTPLERFAAVRDAMAEVRADDPRPADDPDVVANERREAAMRKVLRSTLREVAGRGAGDGGGEGGGEGAVAVVCGAWHAPALEPGSFPPAARDAATLRGLPRLRTAAAWTPWTSGRLAYDSGYGAGVDSPGWYQHLFAHWQRGEAGDVVSSWLVRVARELRHEQLDASTASVVEAARLAEALAAVRGRPSVGLSELDAAAQAVLCDGSRLPLELVHRRLVVGEELGTVPDHAPVVPLAADLARRLRGLRLKQSASATTVVLDLRKPAQLARSVLLHRLALLDVAWGREVDAGRTTGTFKEAWELEWRPELAVDLVEASVYGTTVEAAADARVAERAREADLAELGGLVALCLRAELSTGVAAVVRALEERTATQHDVVALLGAVEPLARTCRYGDVRGVDVGEVRGVLGTTVTRACLGLPAACAALDDDAAARLRVLLDAAGRGLVLLSDPGLDRLWHEALTTVSSGDAVHGAVAGRATRLLLDADRLGPPEVAAAMSRRLSTASPAPQSAAWLDGFLAGDALLLLHDPVLLGLVDDWVARVGGEVFDDLLPLLRRTFSGFAAAERRMLGEALSRRDHGPADDGVRVGPDVEQARAALEAVARLLSWEVVA